MFCVNCYLNLFNNCYDTGDKYFSQRFNSFIGHFLLEQWKFELNRTTATEPKFKEPIYLDLFELLVLLSTGIYSCDISTEQTP